MNTLFYAFFLKEHLFSCLCVLLLDISIDSWFFGVGNVEVFKNHAGTLGLRKFLFFLNVWV